MTAVQFVECKRGCLRCRLCLGDWWQYLGCASSNAAHMSISAMQGSISSRSQICSTQNVSAACGGGSVDVTALGQSNVFLRCLPAVAAVATGGGLKNAFVIVQITRFEQVIGVFTIQAPTDAIKVLCLPVARLLIALTRQGTARHTRHKFCQLVDEN